MHTQSTSEESLDLFLSPLLKDMEGPIKKHKVIVIAGPTAVGKSDFAISLAKTIGGEIISADAMQVYKGLDIGTAKVPKEKMGGVPHHLLNIKKIGESFNVVDYYYAARNAIKDILLRNNVPIVAGGSGFYLHVLMYGPPGGPPPNADIRAQLQKQMEFHGPEVLYERLQMLDPEYAATITEKDRLKIIRALEIIAVAQKKVSDFEKPRIKDDPYLDFRAWFLFLSKEILFKRIEERCHEMVNAGFVEEVRKYAAEIKKNRSAYLAIGYRQCLEFLNTEQTEKDRIAFIEAFEKASKAYVKKQFTWFKKDNTYRWLDLGEIGREKAKEYILQDYEQG